MAKLAITTGYGTINSSQNSDSGLGTLPQSPSSSTASSLPLSSYLNNITSSPAYIWPISVSRGLAECLERLLGFMRLYGWITMSQHSNAAKQETIPPSILAAIVSISLVGWFASSATTYFHMTGLADKFDEEREGVTEEETLSLTHSSTHSHKSNPLKVLSKRALFVASTVLSFILVGGTTYHGFVEFTEGWTENDELLKVAGGILATLGVIGFTHTEITHFWEHLWEDAPHTHKPISMGRKTAVMASMVLAFGVHAVYNLFEGHEVTAPWFGFTNEEGQNKESPCEDSYPLYYQITLGTFSLALSAVYAVFESAHVGMVRTRDVQFWKEDTRGEALVSFFALVMAFVNAAGHAAPSIAGTMMLLQCTNMGLSSQLAICLGMAAIEIALLDPITHGPYVQRAMLTGYRTLVKPTPASDISPILSQESHPDADVGVDSNRKGLHVA